MSAATRRGRGGRAAGRVGASDGAAGIARDRRSHAPGASLRIDAGDDGSAGAPDQRPDPRGALRIDAGAAGAIVSVRVQPRARRSALAGLHGDALKVALRAPPVDGAANEALVKFLASLCAVAPSSVQIVSGQTSRQKRVVFTTLDAAAVGERLGRALEV